MEVSSSELLRLAALHGATFDLSRESTALVSAFKQRLLTPVSPLALCTDLRKLLRSDREEDEDEEVELPSNALALAFLTRRYSALLVCYPGI